VDWKPIATLPSAVLGWAVTLPRVRFLSVAINIETVGHNGDFSWPQAELTKVIRLADSDRMAPSSATAIPDDVSHKLSNNNRLGKSGLKQASKTISVVLLTASNTLLCSKTYKLFSLKVKRRDGFIRILRKMREVTQGKNTLVDTLSILQRFLYFITENININLKVGIFINAQNSSEFLKNVSNPV
jgi:hypothetical protein